VQLLVQVLPGETARPDAVDVDPPGGRDGVDGGGERVQVEVGGGVLHRGGVVEGDLGDDVGERVVALDVRREPHAVPRGLPAGLAREREPQIRIALEAGRPAEAHHGGRRRGALLGEPADRQLRGARRVPQHGLGDPPLRRAQGRRHGADPHEDAHARSIHDILLRPDRRLRKLLTSQRGL
jgi:hypothetical protein